MVLCTRQGAAYVAQQCPHEQPEETQESMADIAACLAQMSNPASYPQEGMHVLTMAMIRTALTYFNIVCSVYLHRVLRKALLSHNAAHNFQND